MTATDDYGVVRLKAHGNSSRLSHCKRAGTRSEWLSRTIDITQLASSKSYVDNPLNAIHHPVDCARSMR